MEAWLLERLLWMFNRECIFEYVVAKMLLGDFLFFSNCLPFLLTIVGGDRNIL